MIVVEVVEFILFYGYLELALNDPLASPDLLEEIFYCVIFAAF
jgi:hypothetical protein